MRFLLSACLDNVNLPAVAVPWVALDSARFTVPLAPAAMAYAMAACHSRTRTQPPRWPATGAAAVLPPPSCPATCALPHIPTALPAGYTYHQPAAQGLSTPSRTLPTAAQTCTATPLPTSLPFPSAFKLCCCCLRYRYYHAPHCVYTTALHYITCHCCIVTFVYDTRVVLLRRFTFAVRVTRTRFTRLVHAG